MSEGSLDQGGTHLVQERPGRLVFGGGLGFRDNDAELERQIQAANMGVLPFELLRGGGDDVRNRVSGAGILRASRAPS